MKKLNKIIFVILSLMLLSSINVWATSYDASLIITNPGENTEEEVNVSWHTSLEGTFIKYTLASDPDFLQSQTILGECKPIPFNEKNSVLQCKATLENLLPDHQYLYQVGKTNMSPTYSFSTAGSDDFSFIHVSDIHSYKSGINNTRVARANSIINTLGAKSQAPEFVIATGDVTAYGTVYEQWETLLGMDSMKSMIYAITPGNHDYYNESAQVTNLNYFNSILNNPNNGATGLTNSTYYFKYGNALFISLNSEEAANNATHRKNQQIWLNEVIANNPADFVIVFTHRPFYTGDGKNSGQASDMKSYFQSIFDNAGVDLVLSGHNHVYARTRQVYQGNVTSKVAEGTVYITGIQIGDRYQIDNTPAMPEVAFSRLGKDADGGSIITVSKDRINMRFLDMNGNQVDTARIYSKSTSINRDEFDESILGEINEEFTQVDIKYKDLGIGRVKKVKVTNDKKELLQEFLNPTTNELALNISPELEKLNINVEFTLRTGDVINKTFNFINQKKFYGTVNNFVIKDNDRQETCLYWDNEIVQNNLGHFAIYVNDVFLREVALDKSFTTLDKVSPYHKNVIEFRTVDQQGNIIYTNFIDYGEESEPLSVMYNLENINLEIGQKVIPTYTVTPNQTVDLEFHSSNDSVATVNELGEITAIGKGTCIINLNVIKRWDVKSEIEITVTEPQINIQYNLEKVDLELGQKNTPAYTLTPNKDVDLEFHSSNDSVAIVNEFGEIMAIGVGTCTITVNLVNQKDVKSQINVIVTKPQVNIQYDLEKVDLEIGQKNTPTYTLTPSQTVDLEFHSSNDKVATVNDLGEITAIGKGTCTITVNLVNQKDIKSQISVTVSEPQINIQYDLEKINLEIGQKNTPTYTITPSQTVDLEFYSSDDSVAIVNEFGEITAIGKGSCTITVNLANNKDTKSQIEVIVSAPNGSAKKGCFGSISAIIGINLIGFIILFRKRKIF